MSTSSEMQIRRTATTRSAASSNINVPRSASPSTTVASKVEPILYNDMAVRFNEINLEQCRTSVSALSGCVAGIIGLTSYKGFLFYSLSMIILSFLIFLSIRHEYRKYFTSLNQIFINGFLNGLLTYVLFWTFLYGMVHVY